MGRNGRASVDPKSRIIVNQATEAVEALADNNMGRFTKVMEGAPDALIDDIANTVGRARPEELNPMTGGMADLYANNLKITSTAAEDSSKADQVRRRHPRGGSFGGLDVGTGKPT